MNTHYYYIQTRIRPRYALKMYVLVEAEMVKLPKIEFVVFQSVDAIQCLVASITTLRFQINLSVFRFSVLEIILSVRSHDFVIKFVTSVMNVTRTVGRCVSPNS